MAQLELNPHCSLSIQVTPGIHERFLTVEAWNDPPPPPPSEPPLPGTRWFIPPVISPVDVIPQYLEGVAVGLFPGSEEGQRGELLHTSMQHHGGATRWTWELRLPPLPPAALVPLVRMLAGTTSIRELRIIENAPPESAILRTVESLGDLPLFEVPWAVDNRLEIDSKDSIVTVTLAEEPAPEVEQATFALLRAWGEVVTFGGFASDHPARGSSAVIGQTGAEMPEELFITFDFLMCAVDGWNALAQGLSRIHRHAPIRRVEMT